jgi:hypothetical protein
MGSLNTACGNAALLNNTTGSGNLAVGLGAGDAITVENNNIDIGHAGVAGDSGTTRIGTAGLNTKTFIAGINGVNEGSPTAVFINTTTGQLGTTPPASSRRFKKEIKPMDKTSEAILGLKPVTFHYKSDTKGTAQFGLIAEEVAAVNPDLVVRDENGDIYSVRYEAVNAMLLNEFLKEHRKVEEQEATINQIKSNAAKQGATIALQQQEIQTLTASLKEQSTQIQKVSDQLEVSRSAPQTVANGQ